MMGHQGDRSALRAPVGTENGGFANLAAVIDSAPPGYSAGAADQTGGKTLSGAHGEAIDHRDQNKIVSGTGGGFVKG
ncbi:MAG TPA: hypothetical protein VIE66_04360 [Methylocella sp.]|jgi:hypothetical protein